MPHGKRKEAEAKGLAHPDFFKPEDLCEEEPIWARQPRESSQAWSAFVSFRDLAPRERTIAEAANKEGKSRHTLVKWCHRWRWTERARAYDEHNDAVRQEARDRKSRELGERQATELAVILGAVMQPARALLEKVRTDPEYLRQLSAYDLAQLVGYFARALPRLIEVERLVHGLPARTDRREHTGRDGGPV